MEDGEEVDLDHELFDNDAIEESITRIDDKKRIIMDVKNNPCLWNTETSEYNQKSKRNSALTAIATTRNTTVEAIKKLMHSLRTSMTREIKRGMSDTKYQSKWPLYSCMEFIKEDILKSLKVRESPKWSDEDIDTLINSVKEHPFLWNHQLKEYRDRNKRSQAFDKIAVQFIPSGSKSPDDCRKQWQLLKIIFNKNCARHEGSKRSGTGTNSVYVPTWKFYECMMFAKECYDLDSSTSTLDDSISCESGDLSTDTDPPRKKRERGKHKATGDNEEKEFHKAKIDMYHAAITALKEPLPCSAADDEVGAFGKYIVETLKRFNPLQRTIARKKINDVLFSIDMEGASTTMTPQDCLHSLTYQQNADLTTPITSTGKHPSGSTTRSSPWQTHSRQGGTGMGQLIYEVRDLFIYKPPS